MSSHCLTDLPEEIVSRIAHCITDDSHLLALALTSQQLHRICAEILYRSRHLQLGRVAGQYDVLKDLTIRFLSRPDLASCVKHLSIRGEWTADWQRTKLLNITKVDPVIKSAIYDLTKDKKERRLWLNDTLDREREEALVVLLICSLPNLRSLDTDLPKRTGRHFTWLMKKLRSSGGVDLFRHLQDIVVVACRSARLDLGDIKPIISLHGLRRVFLFETGSCENYLTQIGKQDPAEMLLNLQQRRLMSPAQLTCVEHLELRMCSLALEEVCGLIAQCRALHTFIYERDAVLGSFRYSTIISTLCWHAKTLRNLSLTRIAEPIVQGSMSDDGLSLLPLHRLQSLQIPGEYTLGTNLYEDMTVDQIYHHFKGVVPASVCKLNFDGHSFHGGYDDDIFLSVLRRVALDTPTVWPCLNKILIDIGDSSEARHEALRRVAREHNLSIEVKIYSSDVSERGWGMEQEIRWAEVDFSRTHRNRWRLFLEKTFNRVEDEQEIEELLNAPSLWDQLYA